MPGFTASNNKLNHDRFLKKYRWKISVFGNIDIDTLYVKSVKFPSLKIGTEDMKGISISYPIAKEAKFDDISIVFYETADTLKELLEWKQSVYDFDKGVIRIANEYMSKIEIVQIVDPLLIVAEQSEVYKAVIFNAFPKSLEFDNLDYATGGIKLITMAISYSHAKYEYK